MSRIVPVQEAKRGRKPTEDLHALVCRFCQQLDTLTKYGHRKEDGKQVYKCNSCGRRTALPSRLIE